MKPLTYTLLFLTAMYCVGSLAAQQPELVTIKDGHIGPVQAGCFSPDLRYALTSGRDRRVVLWDLSGHKYVRHFETPNVPLHLAFTHNGRKALVLTYDRLFVWDLETGAPVSEYPLPDHDQHHFRSDTLWLEKNDRPVAAWSVRAESLQPITPPPPARSADTPLDIPAYPALARRMQTISVENVKVTPVPSRALAVIYGGNTTGYWGVIPGAAMNRSGSGFLLVWDLLADAAIDTLIQFPEEILQVVISPQGTRCLALSEDKKVYHVDLPGARILHTFQKNPSKEIRHVFARDVSSLAMVDYHGKLRTWSLRQRSALLDYSTYLDTIGRYGYVRAESVVFTPDNASLLVGDRMGTLLKVPLTKPISHRPFTPDPHLYVIQDLVFSPDGTSVLVGSAFESRVMGMYADVLPKNQILGLLENPQGEVIGFRTPAGPKYGSLIEDNEQEIYWSPNRGSLSLWHTATGSLERLFYPYEANDWVKSMRLAFSPDGHFAFARIADRWQAWEVASGDLLSLAPKGRPIDGYFFRDKDGYALTLEEDGQVRQWPLNGSGQGALLPDLRDIRAIACAGSDGFCWMLDHAGTLFKWMTASRHISQSTPIGSAPDQPELFTTPDPDYVLIRDKGAASLVHMPSGTTRIHLERDPNDLCEGDLFYDGHRASDVSLFTFLPDQIHAISATFDGNMMLWNYRTGEHIATIAFPGDADWVVSTPEGLFDASEGAMREMYFRIGMDVLELEQLKERYFEPGLLQKLLGFTPGGTRPVEGLGNVALYPLISGTVSEQDRVTVTMQERDGGIGRVALLLNHNIELQANVNPDFAPTFSIDLSAFADFFSTLEDYTLSIRAYNEEGWLKSPPLIIRAGGVGAKGGIGSGTRALLADKDARLGAVHLYALVIGTSTYRGDHLNLMYPAKDALAFAEALRITAEPLFRGNVSITTLTTDGPTWPRKKDIRRAFAEIAAVASPHDILLVYFSGHGITYPPNSEKGQFYYLTTDILSDKLDDPLTRMTQAIGQDTLQEWIRQVKAHKRILILDACNSGKVVENFGVGEKSLNSDQRRALERMYDRSGMFVLAGSAGDKLSFEASRFGHGLLTYSLLNNMPLVAAANATLIDVGKLFNNTVEEVPRLAQDIGKYQQPELIGNSSFDIGMLTMQTPFHVPQALPVFIRPSFLNIAGNRDNVRLSAALSSYLLATARAPDSGIAFWDIDDFQGAYYYIGGTYTLSDDQITCQVSVYERDTLVAEFTIEGTKSQVDALARNIADKAFLLLDQRN